MILKSEKNSILQQFQESSSLSGWKPFIKHWPKQVYKQEEIWACSPIKRSLFVKRAVLADKKQAFEHLYPRPLIFSTIRVGIIQGSQIMTTYFTDQMEYEAENEELIVQGKLTPIEADKKNLEWEEREWQERWKQLPKRFIQALLKLQAAIMCMRFYEHMASKLFSERTLDKLTKDPFKSATRKADKYENYEYKRWLVGKKMFRTCLWGNAISFFSDYTVQQCLLLVGHCAYYRRQRILLRKRRKDEDKKQNDKFNDNDNISGGIGLSLALKSSNLMISRGSSWILSSASGAIGSAIYPGWGTLFGTQLGDGIAGALIDG